MNPGVRPNIPPGTTHGVLKAASPHLGTRRTQIAPQHGTSPGGFSRISSGARPVVSGQCVAPPPVQNAMIANFTAPTGWSESTNWLGTALSNPSPTTVQGIKKEPAASWPPDHDSDQAWRVFPVGGLRVCTRRWVLSEIIPSTPQRESQRMDFISLTVHTKSF